MNWFVTLLGSPARFRFLTSDPLAICRASSIADVWQWTPFVMLVLFAALQSMPEYVYEAARMDGLSGWQIFWRITLPLLRPAIWVVLILRIVDAFRMIELVYHDDPGRPRRLHRDAALVHLHDWISLLDLGYAAAMAVLMLILVTIVLPAIRAQTRLPGGDVATATRATARLCRAGGARLGLVRLRHGFCYLIAAAFVGLRAVPPLHHDHDRAEDARPTSSHGRRSGCSSRPGRTSTTPSSYSAGAACCRSF